MYAGTETHGEGAWHASLRTRKLQVFHVGKREALPQYKIKAFSTVMSTAAKLWQDFCSCSVTTNKRVSCFHSILEKHYIIQR